MDYRVCCFTGHRPSKLQFKNDENSPLCLELKERIRFEILNMIIHNDVRKFISGMALGVDTWAAEIVLELKELYSDLTLCAAVPFAKQSEGWSEKNRTRYDNILDLCDEVVVLGDNWTYDCMMKRNRYMVDNSDFLIAVWNGSYSGGTGKTVKYAHSKGKNPIIIRC